MIDAAYEHCAAIARRHYENFPVASWLLPRRMRPHIAAIYAFARTADDFADEPHRHADERLRLLDDWQARLHRVVRGQPETDLVLLAVTETIRRCDLPVQLFDDLLSAFRQDVTVNRYEAWGPLLDYCSRSANPVGRLVLRVANVRSVDAERASDALCTALQLTNFWQDFGRDWHHGRLYVPLEEVRQAGADEKGLTARQMPSTWKAALRVCVRRTREFFDGGRPVTEFVDGRLRYELRATWLGGSRILDKVQALDYDTLHSRPTLSGVDALAIVPGVLMWKNRTST